MNNYLNFITTAIILLLVFGTFQNSRAQSIELLGGNTLNGAVNGAMLGGAVMALQNSDDIDPVRVGVGVGTLYGIGVGVYDITRVSPGQQFYISGTFNDGNNSTIIVLLDTFYGAAAGAVVASAVILVANQPLIDGLQYGSGVGAWIGFGFGLIDAFTLAERPGSEVGIRDSSPANGVGGLVTYANRTQNLEVGLLNPGLVSQKRIGRHTLEREVSVALDVLSVNFRF